MNFIIKIFAVMVGFLELNAEAKDYSKETERQGRCETAGEVARSHHGISQVALRAAVSDAQRKMDEKKISKKLGGDTQYLIWIGYSAGTPKEAFMKGWGWCMDQKK